MKKGGNKKDSIARQPDLPGSAAAAAPMSPYTDISEVYDYLLRHVDYERWYRYIRELIFRYMTDPSCILEIGCGTGKFGAKFSRDDFTVYGMDSSLEMLQVARARAFREFRIFCADVRNFSLSKKMDFIFSVHDTMNYLITVSDFRNALRSVRSCMHDESIFMFDLTTEYNIRRFFDLQEKRYRHKGISILWDNRYNARKKIISSVLTFTYRDGRTSRETHLQRIYSRDEVLRLLHEEGFEVADIFSDYSFLPPGEETVMVNYVVRKAHRICGSSEKR
ncbi:MAG TPA: class I SAM-dependent methyltransferase [Spirochaetota bacterium]|nr:class I SAM-dependent methyltransferase [Spirochaetota bacterium]